MPYKPTDPRREWRTATSAGAETNLYICQECGAVVAHESTPLHDAWHLRMIGEGDD